MFAILTFIFFNFTFDITYFMFDRLAYSLFRFNSFIMVTIQIRFLVKFEKQNSQEKHIWHNEKSSRRDVFFAVI